MNIEGKVIVITGAARGIGQEYARYLSGLGARIVAADIKDCSHTLDLVKTERGTAVGAKLDVASAASAMTVAQVALDAFGRIDALVNNAALYGGLKGGRFDTISESARWTIRSSSACEITSARSPGPPAGFSRTSLRRTTSPTRS